MGITILAAKNGEKGELLEKQGYGESPMLSSEWEGRLNYPPPTTAVPPRGVHTAIRKRIMLQDLSFDLCPARFACDQHTSCINDLRHIGKLGLGVEGANDPLHGLDTNMQDGMTGSTHSF